MIKMMITVARAAGTTHEQLLDVWENVHIPHVADVIQPLRYIVTFFHDEDIFPAPDFDGMAELWFRDQKHFDEVFRADPANQEKLTADGFGRYIDPAKLQWYPLTEYVNVDGTVTRETVKLVYYVRRKEGVARDALHRSWLDVHLPNVAAAVSASNLGIRYTVSLVTSEESLPYDGVAQIWMAGSDPSISELGIELDAFSEVMGVVHSSKGHEITVIE
jgi:hypothetical protein|tara:strand:+ start:15 stop:668 length:654 start_codon:yes stop_codon:yes gene_type:complete